MRRDPNLFLSDIVESIGLIEKYTKKLDYKKFLRNDEAQDAVMRRIEIIGEATRNLPAGIKRKHPDIPWKQIAGMRNILAHEYFGVAMKRIWDTTQKDLPRLKKQISKLLKEANQKKLPL